MLKVKLFIVLMCFFLSSCALHGYRNDVASENSSSSNNINVYRTGIDCTDTQDGCLINDLDPDLPAKLAGMLVGDLIISIKGQTLSNKEFLKLMHLNSGQSIIFKIKRNGQMLDFNVTPKKVTAVAPSMHKIYELLNINERKITLAIIIANVKNNMNVQDRFSWEESTKYDLQGDIENGMLKSFSRNKNFMLIDRAHLDNIIEEYKLNMSGLVSDDARTKIGKMTGATHLLIATLNRYGKNRYSCNYEDVLTVKLIDIENGQVLAIDRQITDCQ